LFLELGGVEEEAPAVPLDYTSVTMRATREPVQQQQPKTTHEIARDELLGGDKKQEAGKQLALKQWYRQICRRSSGERSSSWDICLQEDRPNAAGTADNPKLCRKQSVNSNEELCKVGVSYSIHDNNNMKQSLGPLLSFLLLLQPDKSSPPLAACSGTKYSQSILTVASSVVSNTFRFHLDNPSSLS
jgi:hypothetical protein